MRQSFLPIWIFMILISCSSHLSAQKISDKQRFDIEKQIDTQFLAMLEAAGKLDLTALSEGVDDRNHAGFITNGTYFASFDSLMTVYKQNSGRVINQVFTVQKKKITVLSPDIALLTAGGVAKVNGSSGSITNVKFLWSFVYERIDGKWQVIQSHQSSVR